MQFRFGSYEVFEHFYLHPQIFKRDLFELFWFEGRFYRERQADERLFFNLRVNTKLVSLG